jgi:uncharacterized protein (TIGR00730 family)
VFGSSTIRSEAPAWHLAEEIGRGLAERGATVLTGGYGGVMEAASSAARDAGGTAIGVTLQGLFPERAPNRFLSSQHDAASLLERLVHLFQADAFVVLEGNVGTLAELFVAWHHALLEGERRRPVLCVGPGWEAVIAALRRSGFVTEREIEGNVAFFVESKPALAWLERRLGA